ncbi:MAG: UPF0716 protein FxsA [Gammaproteobacteria bacterium]|jgi:UPF0716 protein FxsA
MNIFHILLMLFIAVPIAEIWVLIHIGAVIGPVPTVALIVLTAVVGAAVMRMQGVRTLARVQRSIAAGEVPAIEMMEGAFILVAGALLLTPGFVTDTLGFVCLVPPLRLSIIRAVIARGLRMGAAGATFTAGAGPSVGPAPARSLDGHVIEGDYERHKPE